MALTIGKNSYLNFAQFLSYSGTTFWDQPNWPQVVPQKTDTFVAIDGDYAGRLDLLAYDQYGDPDLWWIIALANNITVIPSQVRVGLNLRIPAKSYVDSLLAKGSG